MMNTMARVVSLVGAVAVLASCGGGGGSTPATTVSAQPQSQTVVAGNAVTLAVSATGENLTYQWNKNGVAIAGATAATYTIAPEATLEASASYTATITGNGGTVTTSAAVVTQTLSAGQKIYDDLLLSDGGSHTISWRLQPTGSQTSGTQYLYSSFAKLSTSPLTAPQVQTQSAPANLTTSLALPARTPNWTLKNGVILTTPATGYTSKISYFGSAVKLDYLASDNVTIAYSTYRKDFSTASLTGALNASPADVATFYYGLLINPAVLNTATVYGADARYVRYTEISNGSHYKAFDCYGTTTTTEPQPCATATLADYLDAGAVSVSDGKTYHTADGVISTVEGVSVWIANSLRPATATLRSTPEYRTYFEINGKVYTGAVVRDGAVIGDSFYYDASNVLQTPDYQIRLNKAARDSIAAASQL